MVGVEGFPAGTDFALVRNGNTIATATDAGDTVLHHDSCWDGPSPDVQGGDRIEARLPGGGVEFMDVRDMALDHDALAALNPPTTTIPVTGSAAAGDYVVSFRFSGGSRHEVEFNHPGGAFSFNTTITEAQRQQWPPDTSMEAPVGGDPFTENTVSDPVAGGVCELASTGIGAVSSSLLNGASSGVTISGPAAGDITSVVVSINGTALPAITPSGGSWSVTIAASQLAEGDNEIVADFTGPSDPGNQTRIITKDTTAPGAAPGVTPGGGTYFSAQSVTLNGVEAGGTAYYTTDGSDPTSSSTPYTGPIQITSSQTLKVAQYDAAGNRGPVASHAYVITSPPAQLVPLPAPVVVAGPPAPSRVVAGSANTTTLSARGLRIRGSRSLRSLRRSGLRYTVRSSAGTKYLLVRLVRVTRSGRRTRRAILQERIIEVRSGGTYSGRLKIGRRTKTGRYELQIAPAGADEDFAPFARTAFRVTR